MWNLISEPISRRRLLAGAAGAAAVGIATRATPAFASTSTVLASSIPSAPEQVIAYPPRPVSTATLGYNLGNYYDDSHVDLAVAGGAQILRTQFAWASVENYSTKALSLTGPQSAFLSYCASKGVKPLLVAAYGPPWTTIGHLVTRTHVPVGSPAGTSIPVNPYTFSIDFPHCFAGGSWYTPSGLTGRESYYGSLITSATSRSITLGQATTRDLPAGTVISVQRLQYPPPSTDTDPSIARYLRYVTFLADQIAAAGATGYVSIWNEYPWAGDWWDSLAWQYDVRPASITISFGMKGILTAAQALSLPSGVELVNEASDISGFNGMAANGLPLVGPVRFDSIHPYGDNPEAWNWDYSGWGCFPSYNLPLPAFYADSYAADWWESINPTLESGGNFRFMAFANDFIANAPTLMATECGVNSSNDTQQAVFLARRVASLWGVGCTAVPYILDDGSIPGSFNACTAPQGHPRAAYYALQRMVAVIQRMGASTNPAGPAPTVAGWPSGGWPLMTSTVAGAPGNSVVFVWQRTFSETGTTWASIASPSAASASLSMVSGSTVAEAFNVVTGAPVAVSVNSGTVTLPVTDEVVAVRFSAKGSSPEPGSTSGSTAAQH